MLSSRNLAQLSQLLLSQKLSRISYSPSVVGVLCPWPGGNDFCISDASWPVCWQDIHPKDQVLEKQAVSAQTLCTKPCIPHSDTHHGSTPRPATHHSCQQLIQYRAKAPPVTGFGQLSDPTHLCRKNTHPCLTQEAPSILLTLSDTIRSVMLSPQAQPTQRHPRSKVPFLPGALYRRSTASLQHCGSTSDHWPKYVSRM